MKRMEIIANRAVEADIHEALRKAEAAAHYTKFPVAHGTGTSGPRMGDHIWPEENFVMIIYCDEEEAQRIRRVIAELKRFFRQEGIKLFELG